MVTEVHSWGHNLVTFCQGAWLAAGRALPPEQLSGAKVHLSHMVVV